LDIPEGTVMSALAFRRKALAEHIDPEIYEPD